MKNATTEQHINKETRECFPDGTPIADWFYETDVPNVSALGKQYVLTQHGIFDDGRIHTKEIQALIDQAAQNGGGVIVVPPGVYLTGALFFKQNVHLYVMDGGMLRGSDDISDYPVMETRIEGQACRYFSALVNADSIDGFTILGPGIIDGNGVRAWRAFWLRRSWNPACTNKDEQRPRLVFLRNCTNVTFADVHFQNAHFWTTHLYKCSRVKYLGCKIFSPAVKDLRAPSTDAIDIDVCTDVLIKNCRMEVNDDSVVLKGGRGPWADEQPENGMNERVLIEDCEYGFCHGCLTCGSESVHNKNILMRRIHIGESRNGLWLKMRPDTPQHYEYIALEDITGNVESMVSIHPWTQFFDLEGHAPLPPSIAEHISMNRCRLQCKKAFDIGTAPERYVLRDFRFTDMDIETESCAAVPEGIEGVTLECVRVKEVQRADSADGEAQAKPEISSDTPWLY